MRSHDADAFANAGIAKRLPPGCEPMVDGMSTGVSRARAVGGNEKFSPVSVGAW